MDIQEQRGNPVLLKRLQERAKQVSQSNGISDFSIQGNSQINTKPIIDNYSNMGGAYNSLMNRNKQSVVENRSINNSSSGAFDFEKRYYSRLMESVQMVKDTKEYFSATSALFDLYAMDKLTEGVVNTLSIEDLREIKSIVRDFKSVLERF